MIANLTSSLIVCMLLAGPSRVGTTANPSPPPPPSTETLLVNFEGTPLVEVVKWINRVTGKNFVFDSSLSTVRLTILSGTPVTVDQAYSAFVLALSSEGLEIAGQEPFLQIRRREGVIPEAPSAEPSAGGAERIVPMFDGGKQIGLRVFGIRPSSVFSRWGISSGDVILAIDGHALTSPDTLLHALEKHKPGTGPRIRLLRKGKEQILPAGEARP